MEFTVEPFVEGRPGPHVTAAIDAARAAGAEVEVGPFGSACQVAIDAVGDLVGAITAAAMDHGASHVTVHVARDAPTTAPRFDPGSGVDR